jgi:hypothetical protein
LVPQCEKARLALTQKVFVREIAAEVDDTDDDARPPIAPRVGRQSAPGLDLANRVEERWLEAQRRLQALDERSLADAVEP